MLRYILAVLGLCLFVAACATTGTGSAGSSNAAVTTPVSAPPPSSSPARVAPADSQFWCGEHCSVAARCEDYFRCGCVEYDKVVGALEGVTWKTWDQQGHEAQGKGMESDVLIAFTLATYLFCPAGATSPEFATCSEKARKLVESFNFEIRTVDGLTNEKWLCGVFKPRSTVD